MTIRLAFALGILATAVAYTWFAFTELGFMVRGRLGPGFFPRSIGLMTIGLTVYSIVVDILRRRSPDPGTDYARDIFIFFGYCILLVALMPYLGGLLSMIVFMLLALFTYNRGQALVNIAVSVALPLGLYFLFDVWLNAAFAEAAFPLPW